MSLLAAGFTLGGRVAGRPTSSLLLLSALLLWAAAFASADQRRGRQLTCHDLSCYASPPPTPPNAPPPGQLAQEEYCEGQYPAHRAGFDMGCPDTPIPAHVVGGALDNPAESCYHIWRAWPPAANGPYYVRNATHPTEVVKMDCDMSHPEGPQPEDFKPHAKHGALPGSLSEGVYLHFRHQDVGPNWPSSDGSVQSEIVGSGHTVQELTGYGAQKPVRAMHGGTGSGFYLGGQCSLVVPAGDWTICTVSRYQSGSHQRIWNGGGGSGNFLHSHWGGYPGVMHYSTWVTNLNSGEYPREDWIVACGTNNGRRHYVNGCNKNQGYDPNGNSALKLGIHLNINANSYCSGSCSGCSNMCCYGETSDYAVAEVITWSRSLSDEEFKLADAWLAREVLGVERGILTC